MAIYPVIAAAPARFPGTVRGRDVVDLRSGDGTGRRQPQSDGGCGGVDRAAMVFTIGSAGSASGECGSWRAEFLQRAERWAGAVGAGAGRGGGAGVDARHFLPD